jgi:GT2 family glycosyltransferase
VESQDRGADVGVVVVNWNDAERSIACLQELTATGYTRLRLVLVDNDSDEDPTDAASAAVPGLYVLRLERNRGYAAGCNAGASVAISMGANYLFFLNNDTKVDRRCLDELVLAAASHPGCVLGPKLVYADQPEVIWAAGGAIDRSSMANYHIGNGEPAALYMAERRVDWLTGCALFLSAETYARLGPMDEEFFLYLEDVDWSLTAEKAGIERWLVPSAVVKHAVSATTTVLPATEIFYYGCRNTLRLAIRQTKWPRQVLVRGRVVLSAAKVVVRNALFESRRRDPYYRARSRAVLDALRGHWGKAQDSVGSGARAGNQK